MNMTLEKQIELLKEWNERAEMYLPIMSSEDIKRFLHWLEDYKQLKSDYIELDNRLRTANTEIDRLQSVNSWFPCGEMMLEDNTEVIVYDDCILIATTLNDTSRSTEKKG
jgi:hypothetical protein